MCFGRGGIGLGGGSRVILPLAALPGCRPRNGPLPPRQNPTPPQPRRMRYITSIGNRSHFAHAVTLTEAVMGSLYLLTGGAGGSRPILALSAPWSVHARPSATLPCTAPPPTHSRPNLKTTLGVVGYAALGKDMDIHRWGGQGLGLIWLQINCKCACKCQRHPRVAWLPRVCSWVEGQ